jgi:galactitol-specific phosphotransferase system IIB component
MKTTKSGELFGADVATRSLRKKAVENIIEKLNRIMKAEECHMENIPDNLRGSDAFFAAEECAEILYSAIGFLYDAYDN